MTEVKLRVPDGQTPGYLRRERTRLQWVQEFEDGEMTPEKVDLLVDWLVEFVEVPKDRKKAKEALWDASFEQFGEILNGIGGSSGTPEKKDEDSGDG